MTYANLLDLTGRVAIVTGAANGLGREIALAFADNGGHLVLADIDEDGLGEVAGLLSDAPGQVLVVPTDVSAEDQVNALVQRSLEVTGTLDVLVHCAGIGGRAPAEEYPMELWDRVMEVNAGGTFLCSQAAGRVMIKQDKGGSILNLSSIGGMVGKPGSVAYQVGKAMEIQLVKSLGVEWGEYGVRVNSIAPGSFITATIRAELEKEPTMLDNFMKHLPMKRHGEVSEIVGAALFLASDASSYITGAVIPVDGGVVAA